jgi:predicted metalloprotease with PDZ domain
MRAAHESDDKDLDLRHSLGFFVDDEQAALGDVIPGSPADAAGASRGSRIMALNGYRWSKELLHDTVPAPTDPDAARGKITLVVQKDDTFKTLELVYAGGERYPNLVRQAGTVDLLGLITRPRAPLPAPH